MHGQIRRFAKAVMRGHEDARVHGHAGARTRGCADARVHGRRGAQTRGRAGALTCKRGREEEFVRKSWRTHEDLRSGSFGCWWKSMKKKWNREVPWLYTWSLWSKGEREGENRGGLGRRNGEGFPGCAQENYRSFFTIKAENVWVKMCRCPWRAPF